MADETQDNSEDAVRRRRIAALAAGGSGARPFGVLKSDTDAAPEEGLRESSFLEIPGAHEAKGKLKKHLEEMDMPGNHLAAQAADLAIPETFGQIQT